jgi:glycosidase
MIYSGQEARVEEKIKFFEKDTIQWNHYPDGNFYKNLINIRKKHSVFWSNNTTLEFLDGLHSEVVGFKRWDSKNIYYVILNFSNQTQEIDSELLSDNYIIKDENSTSNLLASNGYFIFKTKK